MKKKEKTYHSFQELKESWQAFEQMSSTEKDQYLERVSSRYGQPERKGFTRPVDNEAQEIERIEFMQSLRNDHYYTIKEISL